MLPDILHNDKVTNMVELERVVLSSVDIAWIVGDSVDCLGAQAGSPLYLLLRCAA